MPPPVAAQVTDERPEERVEPPETDPMTARRPCEDQQLVPQQQVLRDRICVPLAGRTYDREDAQDEINHP